MEHLKNGSSIQHMGGKHLSPYFSLSFCSFLSLCLSLSLLSSLLLFLFSHILRDNLLALLHVLFNDKVLQVPETTDISALLDILGMTRGEREGRKEG